MSIGSFICYELLMLSWILYRQVHRIKRLQIDRLLHLEALSWLKDADRQVAPLRGIILTKDADRQVAPLRDIILTSSSVVNEQTPVLIVFVVTQTVTVGLNTLKAVNHYGTRMSKHLYTLDFRVYVMSCSQKFLKKKKNYIVLKVIWFYIFTVLVLEEQGVLLLSLLVWDNLKKNIL